MLFKTTLRAARSQPTWVRRRWCDLIGHAAVVRSGGPYTAGYARCGRCDRVVGPGA